MGESFLVVFLGGFISGAGAAGLFAFTYFKRNEMEDAKLLVHHVDRAIGISPRPVYNERAVAQDGEYKGYPVHWINGYPDCRRDECMNTAPHEPGERCIT